MVRSFARELRSNATRAERRLWSILRRKQFGGHRFRRQQPIGPYIADFCCLGEKLIIELDGSQHFTDDNIVYDAARTAWLRSQGFRVVRFPNRYVFQEREIVMELIARMLDANEEHPPPSRVRATPPPQGGR